jgi:type I restriction enzyme, S subunit
MSRAASDEVIPGRAAISVNDPGTEVPEGWTRVRLTDVARLESGHTPSRKHPEWWGGDIPWVSLPDAREHHGRVINDTTQKTNELGLANSAARWLPKDTVCLSRTASVGYVFRLGRPMATSQDFVNWVCSDALEPRFLMQGLLAEGKHILSFGMGTTHTTIYFPAVLAFHINLAPLPEQRRIVTHVEALLEQVNRAKARLDRVPLILKRFRQAVLAAACSGELTREWRELHPDAVAPALPDPPDEVRRGRRGANLSGNDALLVDDELPELPDPWAYTRIDRLAEPGTVITYGIVLPGPEVPGGVPYVRGQDVEDGVLRTDALRHTTKEIAAKHPRSSLRAGDVLLCIIRNLRVAVVPKGLDGANITQGMVRIRTAPSVALRDFVALYLMSPLAQGWMKRRYFGMDMPRINVEDARAIPVALPPLGEQAEIVRQVQKLFALADVIERRVKAAAARADTLPKAILAKAFSGDLVPTEADLARTEGRTYETAADLLTRVRREAEKGGATETSKSNGRASKLRAG